MIDLHYYYLCLFVYVVFFSFFLFFFFSFYCFICLICFSLIFLFVILFIGIILDGINELINKKYIIYFYIELYLFRIINIGC